MKPWYCQQWIILMKNMQRVSDCYKWHIVKDLCMDNNFSLKHPLTLKGTLESSRKKTVQNHPGKGL